MAVPTADLSALCSLLDIKDISHHNATFSHPSLTPVSCLSAPQHLLWSSHPQQWRHDSIFIGWQHFTSGLPQLRMLGSIAPVATQSSYLFTAWHRQELHRSCVSLPSGSPTQDVFSRKLPLRVWSLYFPHYFHGAQAWVAFRPRHRCGSSRDTLRSLNGEERNKSSVRITVR